MATEVVRLGPGKHTVVAVGGDKGVDLLVYRDDGLEPGKATLRAIHVASEVGKADVRVDGKVVATGVGLGDATGYLPLPPGRHSVAVTRPGGDGGALVQAQVRAVAGTAASGFVVGSAGMPAQIVLTEDATAGPIAAPATGLGGATSGGGWLLIIGSSLIGGSLGGASYVLARRTRRRGALHVATPAVNAGAPTPSSVAAGPPLGSEEAKEPEAAKETTEAPAPAAPPAPPPLAAMPVLPASAAPALDGVAAGAPVAHELDAIANGSHPPEAEDQAENGSAAPAPTLWAPPPGERWTPAPGPTGRFIRADVEPALPAPGSSRFVRPDADLAASPDPAIAAPTPLMFTSPPVADIPAPDAPRPLSPWPEGPAPMPYPPGPSATPEPPAPETDEVWTGSWIAEPAVTPEPPAMFIAEPAPVEETVVEPAEPVEAPPVQDAAEETIVNAVDVVEIVDAVEVAEVAEETPEPEPKATGVSTWSSTAARPGSATGAHRPHRVNFLVVSGAALVVTGLVVARRGGRH